MKRWVRTCQSCGHELSSTTEPQNKHKPAYGFRKCAKCGSEDYDYGSWRGYDTQPWRDKFEKLTGKGLVMTESELDALLDELGDEGLFEGNELFKALVERSERNAQSIASSIVSDKD